MSNNNKIRTENYPPELVDAITKDLRENQSERQSLAAAKFFEEEAKKIERGERSEFLEFVEREVGKVEFEAFCRIVSQYRERELKNKPHKVKIIGITSSGDPVIEI